MLMGEADRLLTILSPERGAIDMSYRDFTWAKAKQDFSLTTLEGEPFFLEIPEIKSSSTAFS